MVKTIITPRVSILMPMRDAAGLVAEALGSILTQIGPPFEIIVVDDGSTDGSAGVVRGLGDPRIRLLPGPERGISAALNTGLAVMQGEFVMRCDADDRYLPGRIARQVGLLDSHPGIGAVTGAYRTIDPTGRLAATLCEALPEGDITELERGGRSGTHLCTFAIRTSLLRELGGFREAFATAEDIDLKLRLAAITRIWFNPEPVYEYRLHNSSITHLQSNARRLFYENLARTCQQERAAGGTDCVARGDPPEPPEDSVDVRSSAEHVRDHMVSEAWRRHRKGDWGVAVRSGLRAALLTPGDLSTWRNLLVLALKPPR